MVMKKQYFWSFIFLLGFSVCLNSLVSGQQRIMMRPAKYDSPHRNVDWRPVGQGQSSSVPWFVVVAANNVFTTTAPGGSQRFKSVDFGEIYWVVEEEGNYLRIAKDERPQDMNLSSRAENYGWVGKEHLLLWQRALQNPESKISLKGMILNTTRALSRNVSPSSRIQAYKDPDMRIPANFDSKIYEIFYVYKYSPSGRSVLLGRNPFFSARQQQIDEVSGNIVGWFDLDRVLEWDHRVAIEPNWQPDAMNERKNSNVIATVFNPTPGGNPDRCAKDFASGRTLSNCDVAWNHDILDDFKRKNGYYRRFPVMGDFGVDVYKISVMGELRSQTGVISEGVDVNVRQSLNQLIERIRNINVVFVIDGTSSMGPYYQSVINSVQRIVQLFEAGGEQHKELKFGYVVYRDNAERNRLVETQQLTANAGQVVNRLRRVNAGDELDADKHEAVYFGLKTAMTQVFSNPDETNILIHIGDAGSHYRDDPSQVPQREIVDLMADNQVYYIAFQAHHMEEHQAYIDFPHQIRAIMAAASLKMYDNWVERLGQSITPEKPVLREVRTNVHRIENGSPMVVLSAGRGNQMDVKTLEDEITTAIGEINDYIDKVVERTRQVIERGEGIQVVAGQSEGIYASSFAPGFYNMLVRIGLDESVIRGYYDQNAQLVSEGYAPRFHPQLNKPAFVPVLLLEATEFHGIVSRVRRLRQATQAGDQREQLYSAWIELLKGHVGVRPDSYFQEITLENAASIVFGVPMRSGLLQQIKLKDIHDPAVFPNTVLGRYLAQIDFKSRELDRIANTQNYEYSFKSNDILYYWIDVDILP